MKRLFTLFAILLFAACGNAEQGLTVISYNMRYGSADDGDNSWEYRKTATIAMINDQKPDLMGVQEALDFQLAYISENCPEYGCYGVGREDGVSDGEHMSIFYRRDRFEVLDARTIWLSETPEVPSHGWDAACYRTATILKLKDLKAGNDLFYVNTHLDHVGHQARVNGLQLICDEIEALSTEQLPFILSGDFNIPPTDPAILALDERMLSARTHAEQTDSKQTYTGWRKVSKDNPYWVIDYIYYKGFSRAPLFKTLDQDFADIPFISDHYPVRAELVY